MSEELSDEEKSYQAWVVDNLYYIRENKDCIKVMKNIYMAGFSAGYMYKKKYDATEQLQK